MALTSFLDFIILHFPKNDLRYEIVFLPMSYTIYFNHGLVFTHAHEPES